MGCKFWAFFVLDFKDAMHPFFLHLQEAVSLCHLKASTSPQSQRRKVCAKLILQAQKIHNQSISKVTDKMKGSKYVTLKKKWNYLKMMEESFAELCTELSWQQSKQIREMIIGVEEVNKNLVNWLGGGREGLPTTLQSCNFYAINLVTKVNRNISLLIC